MYFMHLFFPKYVKRNGCSEIPSKLWSANKSNVKWIMADDSFALLIMYSFFAQITSTYSAEVTQIRALFTQECE